MQVPFDPKLWVLPTNFKIQKYYSGDSLGLGTEYGNLVRDPGRHAPPRVLLPFNALSAP